MRNNKHIFQPSLYRFSRTDNTTLARLTGRQQAFPARKKGPPIAENNGMPPLYLLLEKECLSPFDSSAL